MTISVAVADDQPLSVQSSFARQMPVSRVLVLVNGPGTQGCIGQVLAGLGARTITDVSPSGGRHVFVLFAGRAALARVGVPVRTVSGTALKLQFAEHGLPAGCYAYGPGWR